MTLAQERCVDAIDLAAAELVRAVRAGCMGRQGVSEAIEAVRKAIAVARDLAAMSSDE